MKYLVFLLWILLSSCVITVPNIQTQADTCSTLVNSALKVTDQLCGGTSLNQACYGHIQLEAEPQPGFGPFNFSQAGDKIDVTGLRSLRVSAMDTTNGDWGVALMHVQANLPNAVPGQNVTFLILGDVQVKNTVTGTVPVAVSVAALSNVNVREKPELDSFVSGTLTTGQTVTARGRLSDGSWLYIDRPDQNGAGWVYGPSMSNAADIQKLSIVDPDTAFYGPMQAFYLQTGEDDNPKCSEAPENGLIIQTSEGVAQVSLWINEVKIRLGSTAFIQAQRNKEMTITMLEGTSHVEAKGVEYTASAGSQVSVPLDQNSAASAPPSAPIPINNNSIHNLPVQNLDRQITVPTVAPTAIATLTSTLVPPTNTPVVTDTPVATATPTATTTGTPTATATNIVSVTIVATATPTNTSTMTATDTPVIVPTNTFTPTATYTDIPTNTSTPTDMPTATPTETPIPNPTDTPTSTNTVAVMDTATNTSTIIFINTATSTSTDVGAVTSTITA